MGKNPNGEERRKFVRIKKHFIIRFSEKGNPSMKHEISQVEDISKGGMRFSSTISLEKDTVLVIELRTPYISETVHLEGTILDSESKVGGIIYQNRLVFNNLDTIAEDILTRIEKYNAERSE